MKCACGCNKEVPETQIDRIYYSTRCKERMHYKRYKLRNLLKKILNK